MLPSSQRKRDEIVKKFTTTVRNELDVFQSEYEKYRQGYLWYAGEQYTPSQKAYYKRLRRPTNVWNLIFPIFNRILGDYYLNQLTERIYPINGASPDGAAALQQKWEAVAIHSEYRDEFAKTIFATLVRRGVIYPHISNSLSLEGDLAITNVDEFDILFDSRARHELLRDAQYQARMRWMTVPQILSIWPNHRTKLKGIMKDKDESQFWSSVDTEMADMMRSPHFSDEYHGQYKVVEFLYRDYDQSADVAYNVTANESEILILEGKKRELFLRTNPDVQLVHTNRAELIRIATFVPGLNFLLETKDQEIQDGNFDYFVMSAYQNMKRVMDYFGLMQNAMGPQKDFNDQRNRMLDIVNKAASALTAMKPQNIQNVRHVERHISEPGLVVKVNKDAQIEDSIKVFDPPKNPYANQQLSETSKMLLEQIIGVTENMRGETQTAQENATLFAQRVQEASKSLIPTERVFRRVGKEVCKRSLKLLQRYTPYDKAWYFPKIGSQETEQLIVNMRIGDQVFNNILHGDFQVVPIADDANPTMRAAKFLENTELIRLVAELFGPGGVNVEFWLEDAPYEKIQLLIDQIKAVQASMGIASEEDRAAMQMQQIMQAGQAMANAAGDPATVGTPNGRQGGGAAGQKANLDKN